MTKENSIITIPAQHFHINQMMDVCARNLVKNNRDKYSDEDFSKKGFLIVQLTEEIAKKFIEEKENHFACVAIDGEEVAGYLVGCDIKKSGIDLFSNVPELKKFQHETIGHIEKIIEYLNTFPNNPDLLPSDARRLYSLAQMIMEASVPIDLNWKTSDIEDVFPMERMKFYSPSI